MTIKALVVLVALLLLAGMIGRSLGLRGVGKRKTPPIEAARKCPTCEAYVFGSAGCDRPDCPRE
jgi:hypothetical protein